MPAKMPRITADGMNVPAEAIVFHDLETFQQHVEQLEDVEERPVTVDGSPFDRFKALVFADSQRPITVVGRGYRPFQHRLVLGQVGDLLHARKMGPAGYMALDGVGRLSTKLHFPNPRFLLDLRLRSKDEDDLMYLGLALENSYGEPSCALQVEAMGLNPNRGHHMLLGSILGRVRIPHFGDVQAKVEQAISRLTLDAELLANRIQEAEAEVFGSREEAHLALRGAGFGPKLGEALLDGTRRFHALPDPLSAWRIFDAIARFVCSRRSGEQGRNENLRRAQAFLEPGAVENLVVQGRRVVRHEEASREVEAPNLHSTDEVAIEA